METDKDQSPPAAYDSDTITINDFSPVIPSDLELDIGRYNNMSASGTLTGAYGSNYNYGNVTITTAAGSNGTSGSFLYSNGTSIPTWTTNNSGSTSAGLHVTSDATFEGDIKWRGRSLGKLLETIEDRLAILQPDPAKLEKYAALKKAYDHYKLMEKLIGEE
jgi:hypothetical protein